MLSIIESNLFDRFLNSDSDNAGDSDSVMGKKEEEFLKRLQATFKIEAEERLNSISKALMSLEQLSEKDNNESQVESIYRDFHSLKGAARAVSLPDIEMICQITESLLASVKRKQLKLSREIFDLLYNVVAAINESFGANDQQASREFKRLKGALENIGNTSYSSLQHIKSTPANEPATRPPAIIEPRTIAPTTAPISPEAPKVIQQVVLPPSSTLPPLSLDIAPPQSLEKESVNQEEVRSEEIKPERLKPEEIKREIAKQEEFKKEEKRVNKIASSSLTQADYKLRNDIIRVSATKVDSLLLQSEELIFSKMSATQHYYDLIELQQMIVQLNDKRAPLLQNSEQAIEIANWQRQYKALENRVKQLIRNVDQERRSIGLMIDKTISQVKQLSFTSFSTITASFPLLVRDLAGKQQKDIDFTINGSDVECDRRIVEKMKDPLIHILRNCIDHGIETREVRLARRKNISSKLILTITQLENNISISVIDDGRGIDPNKVKDVAIKRGVILPEEANSLDEEAAIALIFRSEVSTSPIITDISGRGLGLAIVRETIERLGGKIKVTTKLKEGTTFQINLPSTIATFRGILLRAGGQQFMMPEINVERIVRVEKSAIATVEERETVVIDNRVITLVSLSAILGLPNSVNVLENKVTVLIISDGVKRVAIAIETALGEQEVIVKSLGKQLRRVRHFSAATVLTNGQVIPILNAEDIIKSAAKLTTKSIAPETATVSSRARQSTILVAEDSITSRMLIKNILEAAGFIVKTAVDGIDALTQLHMEKFDLLVSDVEMPRMSGFDLTRAVRADRKLSELPVILVTGLETTEDRERGIEAGANAYIFKGEFEQGTLLSVIRRLI